MFYSKSTGGFYNFEIHGPRLISAVDPAFEWPQIEVANPAYDADEDNTTPTIFVDDWTIQPPLVEVANPDCKIPWDAIEITDEQYTAMLEALSTGMTVSIDNDGTIRFNGPPPPTVAEITKSFIDSIQAHMDEAAQGYGYDDIKTAVTYADEPVVVKFQEEGRAFRRWRSYVWEYGYAQLELVQNGEREMPTIEDMLAELPAIVFVS